MQFLRASIAHIPQTRERERERLWKKKKKDRPRGASRQGLPESQQSHHTGHSQAIQQEDTPKLDITPLKHSL